MSRIVLQRPLTKAIPPAGLHEAAKRKPSSGGGGDHKFQKGLPVPPGVTHLTKKLEDETQAISVKPKTPVKYSHQIEEQFRHTIHDHLIPCIQAGIDEKKSPLDLKEMVEKFEQEFVWWLNDPVGEEDTWRTYVKGLKRTLKKKSTSNTYITFKQSLAHLIDLTSPKAAKRLLPDEKEALEKKLRGIVFREEISALDPAKKRERRQFEKWTYGLAIQKAHRELQKHMDAGGDPDDVMGQIAQQFGLSEKELEWSWSKIQHHGQRPLPTEESDAPKEIHVTRSKTFEEAVQKLQEHRKALGDPHWELTPTQLEHLKQRNYSPEVIDNAIRIEIKRSKPFETVNNGKKETIDYGDKWRLDEDSFGDHMLDRSKAEEDDEEEEKQEEVEDHQDKMESIWGIVSRVLPATMHRKLDSWGVKYDSSKDNKLYHSLLPRKSGKPPIVATDTVEHVFVFPRESGSWPTNKIMDGLAEAAVTAYFHESRILERGLIHKFFVGVGAAGSGSFLKPTDIDLLIETLNAIAEYNDPATKTTSPMSEAFKGYLADLDKELKETFSDTEKMMKLQSFYAEHRNHFTALFKDKRMVVLFHKWAADIIKARIHHRPISHSIPFVVIDFVNKLGALEDVHLKAAVKLAEMRVSLHQKAPEEEEMDKELLALHAEIKRRIHFRSTHGFVKALRRT